MYATNDTPGTTYQYDPEGNRTGQTSGSVVTTYTWDQRNRLAGAVRATAGTTDRLVTVVYDTFNRRAAAYAGDGTTVTRRSRFDWDGDQVRAQLSDSTTTDRFLMGPGIDNVIADEKSGTVNYLVTDLRGSVGEVDLAPVVPVATCMASPFRRGFSCDLEGNTDNPLQIL